jgi:hypothetical protein
MTDNETSPELDEEFLYFDALKWEEMVAEMENE